MRRLWTLILTPVLALGLLLFQAPAASAFGTEVLGCAFGVYSDADWTANSCEGSGAGGTTETVYFWPHNMSGSYTWNWTVTKQNGTALPDCSGILRSNCILDCATIDGCEIRVRFSTLQSSTVIVKLQLTQSGQTRTISAKALVDQST